MSVSAHLLHRTSSVQQSKVGMLGKCLASPLLTFDSKSDSALAVATSKLLIKSNIRNSVPTCFVFSSRELHSTAPSQNAVVTDEDENTWESCKRAIVSFGFSDMEVEKILGKAYGQIHSPYWGEERNKESPRFEVVNGILNYLKDLGLTDEDLGKLLKKFPEVLGCSLENELKTNVHILEKEWGIKGKPLRNLLLRNPKVLGYNVDCKGDCMAQCTRCWVRF
ncbi:uncharacterized protein [Primulina huaijiensis]|uniref:uncharacterized protein isoform X2 n=2 Tax=Primulina huaijiensis TaxID=1492673 RepID=UPI003CC75D66